MHRVVFELVHFCDPAPGEEPNLACGSRLLGPYTTEAGALAAIHSLQDKPGFRDHPDGFRLFAIEVDRTYFSGGFLPEPAGRDIAIAEDPSPLVGDDSGLADWPDEHDRDPEEDEAILTEVTSGDPTGWLWYLRHFKISETSSQKFEDMGEKLVGVYSSRENACRAIEALRGKPGFRDWPGGFRVWFDSPDGEPDFAGGFGASDDPED